MAPPLFLSQQESWGVTRATGIECEMPPHAFVPAGPGRGPESRGKTSIKRLERICQNGRGRSRAARAIDVIRAERERPASFPVPADATEAEVVRRRRDLAAAARAHEVAGAEGAGAEERAAAVDALAHARLAGIVAGVRARRVSRHAPGVRQQSVGVARDTSRCTTPRRSPRRRTARSRWAESSRRARCPSSRRRPNPRRGSGPGTCSPSIGPRAAARRPTRNAVRRARRAPRTRTPPRWGGACRPSARRPRRPRTRPARPGSDRVRRGRPRGSGGMAPARPRDVRPPAVVAVERNRTRGRGEHDRARDELVGRRARSVLGPERALGDGAVVGRAHEPREVGVGDFGAVHPETVDVDAVNRVGVGERRLPAHRELASRNPDHPGRRRSRGRGRVGDRRPELGARVGGLRGRGGHAVPGWRAPHPNARPRRQRAAAGWRMSADVAYLASLSLTTTPRQQRRQHHVQRRRPARGERRSHRLRSRGTRDTARRPRCRSTCRARAGPSKRPPTRRGRCRPREPRARQRRPASRRAAPVRRSTGQ